MLSGFFLKIVIVTPWMFCRASALKEIAPSPAALGQTKEAKLQSSVRRPNKLESSAVRLDVFLQTNCNHAAGLFADHRGNHN